MDIRWFESMIHKLFCTLNGHNSDSLSQWNHKDVTCNPAEPLPPFPALPYIFLVWHIFSEFLRFSYLDPLWCLQQNTNNMITFILVNVY